MDLDKGFAKRAKTYNDEKKFLQDKRFWSYWSTISQGSVQKCLPKLTLKEKSNSHPTYSYSGILL